jgi:hypothetical protein
MGSLLEQDDPQMRLSRAMNQFGAELYAQQFGAPQPKSLRFQPLPQTLQASEFVCRSEI